MREAHAVTMKLAMAAWALLLLCLSVTEAGRILAFVPIPSRSHLIVFTALSTGLADRGHQVTLVSGLPGLAHPNLKVINVGDPIFGASNLLNVSAFLHADTSDSLIAALRETFVINDLGLAITDHALRHPQVQDILAKPAGYYDAVLIEAFFGQEALVGLGHKFQAPVIAVSSFGDVMDLNYAVGGVINPSYKPHVFLDLGDKMNLLERAKNALFSFLYLPLKRVWMYRKHQELLDRYFPGSLPLEELLTNVSLTIINSHPTLCYPSPTPPNVIYAGGMHINHISKPLPPGIKEFMDGAKDGVVYFSMGSFLRASDMTSHQRSAFMESFRSLKQRVIVKWNADPPENVPSNVLLEPWLPQDDILAHANTRLFITHGGLLSTQEAVYHGVPVLGIPRFGDQMFNMRLAQRIGFGVQLPFNHISRASVEDGIRAVLDKPQYGRAARRLSQLFRDQPLRPLDSAVFWVEHVMRHGGEHLRPASVRLAWYQVLLLDLIVPLALLLIATLLLLRRSTRTQGTVPAPESKKRR